jgi:hypothetical protein
MSSLTYTKSIKQNIVLKRYPDGGKGVSFVINRNYYHFDKYTDDDPERGEVIGYYSEYNNSIFALYANSNGLVLTIDELSYNVLSNEIKILYDHDTDLKRTNFSICGTDNKVLFSITYDAWWNHLANFRNSFKDFTDNYMLIQEDADEDLLGLVFLYKEFIDEGFEQSKIWLDRN